MENINEPEKANKKIFFSVVLVFVAVASIIGGIFLFKPGKTVKVERIEVFQADKEIKSDKAEENNIEIVQKDPRNTELQKELTDKYAKEGATEDNTEVEIMNENDIFLEGKFSIIMQGRGKMTYDFLAVLENKEWKIVYSGNSFSNLMPCSTFKKYNFPESLKDKTDCDLSEINIPVTWKLISGNPRQDCSVVVFDTNEKVHGWYELGYSYVETKEWLLKISEEDRKRFGAFSNWGKNYKLVDASPELEKKLKKANEKNPEELTLQGFSYYCEGVGRTSLKPGSQAFKQK